ncbi:MAG: hypothetical protein Kow0037_01950 [Calditrichia bacterium]
MTGEDRLETKKITLIFFLCLIYALSAFGQTDSLVLELEKAYRQFDYQKCNQIINTALSGIEKFTTDDKITIYEIAGLVAYNNDNLAVAENHFWNLLEIDPTFEMDPLIVSPKHITFFNKVKIEYLAEMNRRLKVMEEAWEKERPSVLEFIVPGVSQLKRGATKSGVWFLGSSGIMLGGLIHSIWDTKRKKSDYEGQNDAEKINALYDKYNSAYKRQYYWGYALLGNWVLSRLHAHFLPGKSAMLSLQGSPANTSFEIKFHLTF